MNDRDATGRAVAIPLNNEWRVVVRETGGIVAVTHHCSFGKVGLARFVGPRGDAEQFVCQCGQRLLLSTGGFS